MADMTSLGKRKRLQRLFNQKSKRVVIVPVDDSLLAGPEGGLRDIQTLLQEITQGPADAIMGFPGLFQRNEMNLIATSNILNLTASTTRSLHTRKVLVATVEQALRLGMDAVGVHVNVSSKYETEMLKNLGEVSRECERTGMPLLGIMYPRTERVDGTDDNYLELRKESPEGYTQLVRHAVRVGVELGVDIIKTQYTGNSDSFQTVVECSFGVPIVIAGGPKIHVRDMLKNAFDATRVGGAGVSFGRNIFNRDKPSQYIRALRLIVHDNASVDEAMAKAWIDCAE